MDLVRRVVRVEGIGPLWAGDEIQQLGRGSVCDLMLQSRMEFVLPRKGMQWRRA